jgi:polyhydroxybutyrate depolymerase
MNGTRTIALVLTIISLPAWLAIGEAVSFHMHNRSNGAIVSSGRERTYLLHVPASYDGSRPVPLVISLHGGGIWGAMQRDVSGWNEVADEKGFIVVYPEGKAGEGPRHWDTDSPEESRFIADLIDELKTKYAIDPRRIYANGLSNGGGMSFALSCTLSDRIAAIGLVGSAQFLDWSWCSDPRAVPMISFHGTADTFTPYRGGSSPVVTITLPDIEEWTAKWAARNRCSPEPFEERVASDAVRRSYGGCVGNAEVVLYRIEGGGHTWPGGMQLPEWFVGPTNTSIDATRTMWEFFERHPRG